MEVIKLKAKRTGKTQFDTNSMSLKTKDFIQKICYQGTASVDMTQYGFIADSKMHPISLMLKPLTEKLKTICEESDHRPRRTSFVKSSRYGRSSESRSVKTSRATEPLKKQKLKSRPADSSKKFNSFPIQHPLTSRPNGVVTFAKTKVYCSS